MRSVVPAVLLNEVFPAFTKKITVLTPLIGVVLTTLLCASPVSLTSLRAPHTSMTEDSKYCIRSFTPAKECPMTPPASSKLTRSLFYFFFYVLCRLAKWQKSSSPRGRPSSCQSWSSTSLPLLSATGCRGSSSSESPPLAPSPSSAACR